MPPISTDPASGVEAHLLPNWVADGEPITIELVGFTGFAGQTVSAVVDVLDSVETWQHTSIPVALDQTGSGSTVHAPGLSVGRHAAVYVGGIGHPEGTERLSHVLMSIANSPCPGGTLEDVMEQVGDLWQAQAARYAHPLGDRNGVATIEHRALCVLEGLYTTTPLRVPGATVKPIERRPTDPERLGVINDELTALGWPTRVPEDRWLSETAARSPMTAIVCEEIWAPDFETAIDLVRDAQERLTSILALNRKATGRLVAIVIEQRLPNNDVNYRVYPPNESYTGNLLGGIISGESQSTLLRQYEGARADPLARLCVDLYAEALAERSRDAKYLRLWSILEFLSGARLPLGDVVTLPDGTSWPGRHGTTSFAAPRVFSYMSGLLAAATIDAASFVAPAQHLYEAVRVWYGRRNATGHYGRLIPGDSAQSRQSWYQWAIRSTADEWAWLDSLVRAVETAIRYELLNASPPIS